MVEKFFNRASTSLEYCWAAPSPLKVMLMLRPLGRLGAATALVLVALGASPLLLEHVLVFSFRASHVMSSKVLVAASLNLV